MKLLLVCFSAALLIALVAAQSKIAFEIEFAVSTQIFDVRGGKGYLLPGDDRLNFARPNSWIISMDNAKGKGLLPTHNDLRKVLKHTKLTELLRDDKCTRSTSHCQGVLETKTHRTITVSTTDLSTHRSDLAAIRSFINEACSSDTHVAFYKEGETLFFNYPRCIGKSTTVAYSTKPSEVQITVNINVEAFLDPQSSLLKNAVSGLKASCVNYDNWLKNKDLTDWLSSKTAACQAAVKVALMFSDFWLIKGGQQKQSINPLPKFGFCDFWTHTKAVCSSWDGKIKGKLLSDILNFEALNNGAGSLLAELFKGESTSCAEWNAFNAHAGIFPMGSNNGKTTLAIEVRKADSEVLAKYLTDDSPPSIVTELANLAKDT